MLDIMKIDRDRVSVVVVHENRILGFHAEDPHNKMKYFFLPGGKVESGETTRGDASLRKQRFLGKQFHSLFVYWF